jgi:P4 family phage/plasmid primase-like protien
MIQILALRNGEVWFDRGMRAKSLEEVFLNPLKYIEKQTEPSERFNMYCTVAECLEQPGRKLLVQHHIPFDIDGIDVPETDTTAFLTRTAHIVCKAIGVPFEKVGVLFSGNGLWVIVGTNKAIEDEEYFKKTKIHYKTICARINVALQKEGLKGSADPSVWSKGRLMRYPGTLNVKKDRPSRLSKVLQSNIERLDFNVETASGVPALDNTDYVHSAVVDAAPTADVKTIMSECKFLAWAQTFPEQVTEPLWKAMLDIVWRFPEGRAFAHKMSSGHPGYSFEETEVKLDLSVESGVGPRTCKNINEISDKCKGCKHFGTKLASPYFIAGPDHIKTEKSGFYNIRIGEDGAKRGKPNYHDLQKKFAQENKYRVTPEGMFWAWKGTHFEEMKHAYVYEYAEKMFNPKPVQSMRAEFLKTASFYNISETEWFSKSTERKMNFQNGVYDIASGTLSTSSTEYGFRNTLPCEYSPTATAPRFQQFMEDITCNRPELIAILQEFMGYVFSGDRCKYEKMLMLSGEGENGKSTLVRVIKALAGGEKGCSSLSIKNLNDPQSRVMLEGKLCNIGEENAKNSFNDVELVKNMVSGGVIQVKRLYMQPYEFENFTKLIMLCNEIPRSYDHTHGFFRKILIIPFDQVFSDAKGNRDNDLIDKLLEELPGIFNWVMEGYRRLSKQGKFTHSDASTLAMKEYKKDTNPVYSWFEEACEITKDSTVEANKNEMYLDFSHWCQGNGIRVVPEMNTLTSFLKTKLKGHGIEMKQHKRSKEKVRYWSVQNILFNEKAKF